MYKNKTFLAVIPARSGSKGIPNKNIVNINGKPLIQYTIDEALKSKYLDKIIVSTDSEKIANIARKCGANVPFLRPAELASDTAKTIDVLIHVIDELKKIGDKYDYVVLLQPTQPLRQAFHIDEAIEKIVNNNESSLVSVSKVKEHPILIRTIKEDGTLENLLKVNSTVRRQDFPDYYKVNGAIYINKINETFNNNLSLNDNKIPYIMEEEYDIDIDVPLDLEIFKIKLREIKR
ncbi:acylneuraminate cytidylyltransferase [Caloranaerobacter azorensis H53214]|uniref:Acylneuraminate cytidylyltransferase n=1 Tax=Caloranaerobacter azorensis H53214 TaxID=1156417 RepID=A0A096BG33_9FIRM|nr:acylneuraminate cytidylyltransferase family protein [Caloranaerobacter azorensis]KGG79683.1 acylneuraminate cytidylyltransferase [Caloranaerobacter azorensis H53214]